MLAISIAADIVPITGENRILAHYGLTLINAKPRAGISELLIHAKKNLPLTLTNVVFIIAPRINAAGRIHEGKKAVQLMTSINQTELQNLALSIENDNIERKKLDQAISDQALSLIENDEDFENKKSTIVFQDSSKNIIALRLFLLRIMVN